MKQTELKNENIDLNKETKKIKIKKPSRVDLIETYLSEKNIEEKKTLRELLELFSDSISKQPVKFVESVDITINTKAPKKKLASLTRKGIVSLPNSPFTKRMKVAVFAVGEKAKLAMEAGADRVGDVDLVQEILSGKIEYDHYISTKDMLPIIGKIAPILGPKNLFPSLKKETLTDDVSIMVNKLIKGVISYTEGKNYVIHAKIGNMSMKVEHVEENLLFFLKDLVNNSSSSKLKDSVKTIYINSTMGPSVKVPLNIISL